MGGWALSRSCGDTIYFLKGPSFQLFMDIWIISGLYDQRNNKQIRFLKEKQFQGAFGQNPQHAGFNRISICWHHNDGLIAMD